MRVLVAEDDPNTRAGLVQILEAEGYETLVAEDGIQALNQYQLASPNLVCLDVMMPGKNGYDVCREIRKLNAAVPVIFISAKSEEIDTVVGLELGADDFIIKPFGVKEVVARIRAVTRRFLLTGSMKCEGEDLFSIGDLEVYPQELRARRGDFSIDLSLRDIELLRLFRDNVGKVLDRNTIFSEVWGIDHLPNSRTLDQQISQLRKRIEVDPKKPQIIRTVHGAGYRCED